MFIQNLRQVNRRLEVWCLWRSRHSMPCIALYVIFPTRWKMWIFYARRIEKFYQRRTKFMFAVSQPSKGMNEPRAVTQGRYCLKCTCRSWGKKKKVRKKEKPDKLNNRGLMTWAGASWTAYQAKLSKVRIDFIVKSLSLAFSLSLDQWIRG